MLLWVCICGELCCAACEGLINPGLNLPAATLEGSSEEKLSVYVLKGLSSLALHCPQ